MFSYIFLTTYLLIVIVIAIALLLISYTLSPSLQTFEKKTSYECGFEPFGDGHNFFNILFYVLGLLFILFDLEIIFILPWSFFAGNLGIFSFWVMIIFLGIIVTGFIFEWYKGALNWT
jgi:NADH-quinone oxidoreductase subunit A